MKKKLLFIISIIVISLTVLIIIDNRNEQNLLLNINSNEYDEIIANDENKIIYIGRPTCPECAEIQPILENIIEEVGVKVYYYNTENAKKDDMDSFNNIKESYNIQYVPVLINYEGDEEVNRFEYSDYEENHESLRVFIEDYKYKTNQ